MHEELRIAIVEDNWPLAETLRLLFGGEPRVHWVRAFPSAEELIKAGLEMNLLLAELELPGMSGVELIAHVKTARPEVNCLAYAVSENCEVVFAAIKAGAGGYMLRSSTPRELIEAVFDLHAGGAPMSPAVARKVVSQLRILSGAGCSPLTAGLSRRQQEVLRALERGQSYKGMAAELHISHNTVHTHLKQIYRKVGAGQGDEAVSKARSRGWI